MLNVLYLLNHAGKAGTERYVETLVNELGGHNGEAKVRPYFAYHEPGLLVERLEGLGVPTRRIVMNSRFDLAAARALAALCEEWDIDLIHCHYLRENYIALLAKRYRPGLRVVYTNHFILANDAVTRLSNRLLDRRQDQMIAVCHRGLEQLVANGWSREKIQVIFNGVDPAAWADGESTLRKELGLPDDRFVMLCASRFAHDKGHAYLMRALHELSGRTDKPFTMVLAGDGELLEPTKALAAELALTDEQVKFIGFRKDMKNLFGGADVYVNSSQHEALSFLIIEAMAAGLPAIVTDMGGNRDILEGPEQGGLLAVYDDPASMAEAMWRMMEEPGLLARCRQNARRNIIQRFDIGKLAQDTYDVYERAVSP